MVLEISLANDSTDGKLETDGSSIGDRVGIYFPIAKSAMASTRAGQQLGVDVAGSHLATLFASLETRASQTLMATDPNSLMPNHGDLKQRRMRLLPAGHSPLFTTEPT